MHSLYAVSHNLQSKSAGFVGVKKDLYLKRSEGNFLRKKSKIISTVIEIY